MASADFYWPTRIASGYARTSPGLRWWASAWLWYQSINFLLSVKLRRKVTLERKREREGKTVFYILVFSTSLPRTWLWTINDHSCAVLRDDMHAAWPVSVLWTFQVSFLQMEPCWYLDGHKTLPSASVWSSFVEVVGLGLQTLAKSDYTSHTTSGILTHKQGTFLEQVCHHSSYMCLSLWLDAGWTLQSCHSAAECSYVLHSLSVSSRVTLIVPCWASSGSRGP